MQKLNFGRHVTSGDRWCLRSSKLHPITFPSSSIFHLLPRLSLPWVTGQLFFCWLLSVQTVSPITLLDWNMTLFISVTVLRLCYPLPLHCPGFYFPLCYEEAFQPQTTLFNNKKKKKNLSRWGEGRGSYPPLGQELGVHNFGLGRRRKKQDFMSG